MGVLKRDSLGGSNVNYPSVGANGGECGRKTKGDLVRVEK